MEIFHGQLSSVFQFKSEHDWASRRTNLGSQQVLTRVCLHLWPDAQMSSPQVVKKVLVHCRPIELLTQDIQAALCWLVQFYI